MVTCGRMDCFFSCPAAGLARCGQRCEYGIGRPAKRWRVKGGSTPRNRSFGQWVECRDDFKRAVAAYLPLIVCVRRLGETTYVGPFSWNATWSPQWCRAVWDWLDRVGERTLDRAVALLVITTFISPLSNHINSFLTQNSTDCKEDVFRGSAFLGKMGVHVERHHGEDGFTIALLTTCSPFLVSLM